MNCTEKTLQVIFLYVLKKRRRKSRITALLGSVIIMYKINDLKPYMNSKHAKIYESGYNYGAITSNVCVSFRIN